jgi:hypothetical protein
MPGTISSSSLSTFAIRRGQDVMSRRQPEPVWATLRVCAAFTRRAGSGVMISWRE